MAQQVRIEVRLPEGHWAGDVSRQNPSGTLRIEEHMPLSRGRGMAKCWSDLDMSSSINDHAGVDSLKMLSEHNFSVDIVAGGGGFLKPLRMTGVVPRTPFEIRDGWVEWHIESSKVSTKWRTASLTSNMVVMTPHRFDPTHGRLSFIKDMRDLVAF